MTYFELKKICKQIDDKRKLIATLRAKGYKTTQDITDMPRGGGISDKVGDTVCSIEYQEELLFSLECKRDLEIESIDDSMIKTAIEEKLLKSFTWNEIALHIGGGNTGDSIRMMCTRYKW